jgi:hypothetical protein
VAGGAGGKDEKLAFILRGSTSQAFYQLIQENIFIICGCKTLYVTCNTGRGVPEQRTEEYVWM